ncbi:alanine racemase [Actinokineospora guangxiensis]|uniref:Alanine racemase n=1 Tax=Actinokineospora guangxiensis TaxID=1490288 RepID=A0ABW0ES80_9PSEU
MSAVLAAQSTRDALLTTDLAAVAENTRRFADLVGGGAVMAVVKADGFGHGAAEVARTALAAGAGALGVTTLAEAVALRAAGIDAPVLSWLNPVDVDVATACALGIELTAPSLAHLSVIADGCAGTGRRARVHLQLDTGMARDGAPPRTWSALAAAARAAEVAGLVDVVGVMGHLATADEPGHPATAAGLAAMRRGVAVARRAGLRPRARHVAATSAALHEPESHLDMVRVGAGLIGIDPSGRTRLRGALRLTAPVVQVRRVPSGTGVGYGHTHATDRETTLALLPLGYYDGLPRAASGRAEVLLAGRRRRVVGVISMDQAVVDVGDDAVWPGEVATVFGPGDDGEPTAGDWADWAGTIPHEIVTGVGPRVRRCAR